jgi:hypothetical protein
MLKALGACLEPGTLQPYFSHPVDPKKKVYVLLDICHMLKLIRNTLGEKHILIDKDGEKICWDYIVALEKLQNKEGLRLGNKLKLAHIKWWQQKMKVNLASQVFSYSVANAIEYCNKELKLPQFQGSEATVKFIKLFDGLFDILNSRNPCAKGYKAPLLVANKSVWDPYLDNACNYILGLKSAVGQLMHTTRPKTGFIGFLAAVKSIKGLFHELVERAEAPMKYLLSYKFSQDHLELFFCAIRSAGGFNNNPTAEQFTSAYKRLLMRSSIQGGKGNCEQRDPTEILNVVDDTCKINNEEISISTAAMIRKYDLVEREPVIYDHDYCDLPNIVHL